jgi:hypothetical protein
MANTSEKPLGYRFGSSSVQKGLPVFGEEAYKVKKS